MVAYNSIAAYAGALGAALATMVANLSAHKRGWDDRWEEFSVHAEKGLALQNQLMALVDADTQAFDAIMAAYGMPKGTEDQKAKRHQAIQDVCIRDGPFTQPESLTCRRCRSRKWPTTA